jgi:1-phosphofructokinase family hexose kinase
MILTVTLNPSVDETIFVEQLRPHDTNRVLRVEVDAGGKGINLARVAHALGSPVMALGFVGGKTGQFVCAVLAAEGVPHDFIWIEGSTRRNLCIEEASGRPPTMLNEPGPEISQQHWEALLAKVDEYLPQASWLALGGSLPPGVPRDAYAILIERAHAKGIPCALDSDGPPMMVALRAKPELIKPNEQEAERLLGRALRGDHDCFPAAQELHERGIRHVVISRGARGADVVSSEGIFRATPPTVQVRSTIGSGDSMMAGILHILVQGGVMEEALRWGTAAGAATATTSGAEIAHREQVLELLPHVKIRRIERL